MALPPPSSKTRLRGYGRRWAGGTADAFPAGLGAGLGRSRAEPPTRRGRGAARLPERGRGGDTEPRAGTRAAPPQIRIRPLGCGEASGWGGATGAWLGTPEAGREWSAGWAGLHLGGAWDGGAVLMLGVLGAGRALWRCEQGHKEAEPRGVWGTGPKLGVETGVERDEGGSRVEGWRRDPVNQVVSIGTGPA